MEEDVKLMAEFMGKCPKFKGGMIKNKCMDCGEYYPHHYHNEPSDYPNDMNALLGVMEKMDIDGLWANNPFCCSYDLIEWACDNFDSEPVTSLPQTLFALLVEKIKEIEK